jgi:RimJ/RimL family protein N-acetyltransferase
MRAWSIDNDDGEGIGFIGFGKYYHRWYLFFEITDELRQHKTFMVRSALKLMEEARKMKIRFLYCDADPCEATAQRIIHFLGFELDQRSGKHYLWRNGDF